MTLVVLLSGAKPDETVVLPKPSTSQSRPSSQMAGVAEPAKPHRHWYQIGRASWYGHLFQGKSTASGESYNMFGLTCAHRSLPLGALVRVTNLRNKKSVVVRVNDRGPIPEDRVIDLSFAAASSLGFTNQGLTPVRLDLMDGQQVAEIKLPLPAGLR